jgi:transposase
VRELLNAILYMLRSDDAWRLLPHDLPPWKTVYHYFRLWRLPGLWDQSHTASREAARAQAGREPQPSVAIMDSQSVKPTGVGGVRGYDGAKKLCGRKRHLLVDTPGLVLRAMVHSAAIQDRCPLSAGGDPRPVSTAGACVGQSELHGKWKGLDRGATGLECGSGWGSPETSRRLGTDRGSHRLGSAQAQGVSWYIAAPLGGEAALCPLAELQTRAGTP